MGPTPNAWNMRTDTRGTQTDMVTDRIIADCLMELKSTAEFQDLSYRLSRSCTGEVNLTVTRDSSVGLLGAPFDPVWVTVTAGGLCYFSVLFTPVEVLNLKPHSELNLRKFRTVLWKLNGRAGYGFCPGFKENDFPEDFDFEDHHLDVLQQPFFRIQAKGCRVFQQLRRSSSRAGSQPLGLQLCACCLKALTDVFVALKARGHDLSLPAFAKFLPYHLASENGRSPPHSSGQSNDREGLSKFDSSVAEEVTVIDDGYIELGSPSDAVASVCEVVTDNSPDSRAPSGKVSPSTPSLRDCSVLLDRISPGVTHGLKTGTNNHISSAASSPDSTLPAEMLSENMSAVTSYAFETYHPLSASGSSSLTTTCSDSSGRSLMQTSAESSLTRPVLSARIKPFRTVAPHGREVTDDAPAEGGAGAAVVTERSSRKRVKEDRGQEVGPPVLTAETTLSPSASPQPLLIDEDAESVELDGDVMSVDSAVVEMDRAAVEVDRAVMEPEAKRPCYRSAVCEEALPSEIALEQHVWQHQQDSNPQSLTVTTTTSAATTVADTDHLPPQPEDAERAPGSKTCPICHGSFSGKEELERHLVARHGARLHPCRYCGQRFALKKNLADHLQRHRGSQTLTCQDCGAAFTKKKLFAAHVRQHMGSLPYFCTVCSRLFSREAVYQEHMERHRAGRGVRPVLGGAERAMQGIMSKAKRCLEEKALMTPSATFTAQSSAPSPLTTQPSAPFTTQPSAPSPHTTQPSAPFTTQPSAPSPLTTQPNAFTTQPSTLTTPPSAPSPLTEQSSTPSILTTQSSAPSLLTAQPSAPSTLNAQSSDPSPLNAQSSTPSILTAQYSAPSPHTAQPSTPFTSQPSSPSPLTTQSSVTPSVLTTQPSATFPLTTQPSAPSPLTIQPSAPSPALSPAPLPTPVSERAASPSSNLLLLSAVSLARAEYDRQPGTAGSTPTCQEGSAAQDMMDSNTAAAQLLRMSSGSGTTSPVAATSQAPQPAHSQVLSVDSIVEESSVEVSSVEESSVEVYSSPRPQESHDLLQRLHGPMRSQAAGVLATVHGAAAPQAEEMSPLSVTHSVEVLAPSPRLEEVEAVPSPARLEEVETADIDASDSRADTVSLDSLDTHSAEHTEQERMLAEREQRLRQREEELKEREKAITKKNMMFFQQLLMAQMAQQPRGDPQQPKTHSGPPPPPPTRGDKPSPQQAVAMMAAFNSMMARGMGRGGLMGVRPPGPGKVPGFHGNQAAGPGTVESGRQGGGAMASTSHGAHIKPHPNSSPVSAGVHTASRAALAGPSKPGPPFRPPLPPLTSAHGALLLSNARSRQKAGVQQGASFLQELMKLESKMPASAKAFLPDSTPRAPPPSSPRAVSLTPPVFHSVTPDMVAKPAKGKGGKNTPDTASGTEGRSSRGKRGWSGGLVKEKLNQVVTVVPPHEMQRLLSLSKPRLPAVKVMTPDSASVPSHPGSSARPSPSPAATPTTSPHPSSAMQVTSPSPLSPHPVSAMQVTTPSPLSSCRFSPASSSTLTSVSTRSQTSPGPSHILPPVPTRAQTSPSPSHALPPVPTQSQNSTVPTRSQISPGSSHTLPPTPNRSQTSPSHTLPPMPLLVAADALVSGSAPRAAWPAPPVLHTGPVALEEEVGPMDLTKASSKTAEREAVGGQSGDGAASPRSLILRRVLLDSAAAAERGEEARQQGAPPSDNSTPPHAGMDIPGQPAQAFALPRGLNPQQAAALQAQIQASLQAGRDPTLLKSESMALLQHFLPAFTGAQSAQRGVASLRLPGSPRLRPPQCAVSPQGLASSSGRPLLHSTPTQPPHSTSPSLQRQVSAGSVHSALPSPSRCERSPLGVEPPVRSPSGIVASPAGSALSPPGGAPSVASPASGAPSPSGSGVSVMGVVPSPGTSLPAGPVHLPPKPTHLPPKPPHLLQVHGHLPPTAPSSMQPSQLAVNTTIPNTPHPSIPNFLLPPPSQSSAVRPSPAPSSLPRQGEDVRHTPGHPLGGYAWHRPATVDPFQHSAEDAQHSVNTVQRSTNPANHPTHPANLPTHPAPAPEPSANTSKTGAETAADQGREGVTESDLMADQNLWQQQFLHTLREKRRHQKEQLEKLQQSPDTNTNTTNTTTTTAAQSSTQRQRRRKKTAATPGGEDWQPAAVDSQPTVSPASIAQAGTSQAAVSPAHLDPATVIPTSVADLDPQTHTGRGAKRGGGARGRGARGRGGQGRARGKSKRKAGSSAIQVVDMTGEGEEGEWGEGQRFSMQEEVNMEPLESGVRCDGCEEVFYNEVDILEHDCAAE